MKLQIWKVYVSEGVMGAIHGSSYPIYEGFVPDLKLTINQIASFISEDCSRYEEHNPENQLVVTPQPEMICQIELSRAQIKDVKTLAAEDNPKERIRRLIAGALNERNLDADDYDEE